MKKLFTMSLACLLGLNAMATAPKVTTNKRFARGATMAFGRMTATGANIRERGFCYAETDNDNWHLMRGRVDVNGCHSELRLCRVLPEDIRFQPDGETTARRHL